MFDTVIWRIVLALLAFFFLTTCTGCDWLSDFCATACPPPEPTIESVIEDATTVAQGFDFGWLRDTLAGAEGP